MRARTLMVTGLIGVALVTATVLQARSASAPAAHGSARKDVTHERRVVAAEGRVSAYPGAEVRVAAERGGRLVSVRVLEGQRVLKGELLAELDADELRAAQAQGQGRLQEARAEARLAELTLARRERLAGEGVLSPQDLDQARRDLEIALARVETWQAEVERQQAQLAKSRILAPISGTLTGRWVDPGETVSAGEAAFAVAKLDRLRVEAEADEADAGLLAVGAPVRVAAHGWSGRSWKARVEEIADAVTPRKLKPQDPSRPTDTRVLSVKVAFDEPTPLKLGTTVELKIEPRD